MAIATVTREVYTTSASNTLTDFIDFISGKLISDLGATLVSSSNNTLLQVFGVNSDSNGRQRILNLGGNIFLDFSYGSSTNSATPCFHLQIASASNLLGNSSSSSIRQITANFLSFTSGNAIITTVYNHPECKGITLSQGYTGNNFSFFIIIPSSKPNWWGTPYAFLYCPIRLADSDNSSYNYYSTLSTLNNSFLGSTNYCTFSHSYNSPGLFISPNPLNNLRSMIGGFHIVTNESVGNTGGVIGTVSPDLAFVNATGLNINSIIQVQGSTARYQTLAKSDNNPVLAVKVIE
jgi:hypothetical protein